MEACKAESEVDRRRLKPVLLRTSLFGKGEELGEVQGGMEELAGKQGAGA
jgi:hypothetical protein